MIGRIKYIMALSNQLEKCDEPNKAIEEELQYQIIRLVVPVAAFVVIFYGLLFIVSKIIGG